MDTILFIFIGMMCLMLGVRVYNAEDINKIFNKRPIEVVDVKKYNKACAYLIFGFGAAAELTIYLMFIAPAWSSSLFTLAIIVEAVLLLVIYSRVERKMLKKR